MNDKVKNIDSVKLELCHLANVITPKNYLYMCLYLFTWTRSIITKEDHCLHSDRRNREKSSSETDT